MDKDTVNGILIKDSINELIDNLDKADISDLAIVYRDKEGKIQTTWIGDTIALQTMASLLVGDIEEVNNR